MFSLQPSYQTQTYSPSSNGQSAHKRAKKHHHQVSNSRNKRNWKDSCIWGRICLYDIIDIFGIDGWMHNWSIHASGKQRNLEGDRN